MLLPQQQFHAASDVIKPMLSSIRSSRRTALTLSLFWLIVFLPCSSLPARVQLLLNLTLVFPLLPTLEALMFYLLRNRIYVVRDRRARGGMGFWMTT